MGPRPGNECGWAPGRGGAGITRKISPPAPCKGGAWQVKTRPAPPRNAHYSRVPSLEGLTPLPSENTPTHTDHIVYPEVLL